jgi:tetratricopeptide (TPR) repeat protein
MIYKKIFLIIILLSFALPVFAVQKGRVETSSVLFDYSTLDYVGIQKEADIYFKYYQKSSDALAKERYLDIAAGKYYILTKIDNSKIKPYVQLGRIYDEKNKSRLAKENFCKAININSTDAAANYYFGDFYYKRNDYKKALYHYNVAYNNGYSRIYSLNLKLATIYEKFADLSNAKKFYDVSYSMKPSTTLQQKIQSFSGENFAESEYYRE